MILTAKLSDILRFFATVKSEGHKNLSATALRFRNKIITRETIIPIEV